MQRYFVNDFSEVVKMRTRGEKYQCCQNAAKCRLNFIVHLF